MINVKDKFQIIWKDDCHSDFCTMLNGQLELVSKDGNIWWCKTWNNRTVAINTFSSDIHAFVKED